MNIKLETNLRKFSIMELAQKIKKAGLKLGLKVRIKKLTTRELRKKNTTTIL